MIHKASLEEVEAFARSIPAGLDTGWFNVHAMAQTLLTFANHIRERDHRQRQQLRAWDSITLAISILIEDCEGMTKKQIRARLEEIYAEDRWPDGGQS